ncbi:MAG: Holliday junction branch migration protein RuvA [Acidobacteriota bacterium]|nr:Holliday junction branch migration protein RuvA [Acidobacteriota bacterium]
MIGRLTGQLARRTFPLIMVDVGGVGYELRVPLATFENLPAVGEPVCLETVTSLKNEVLELFGFRAEEDKRLFTILVGVSGVGPKLALAMLSSVPSRELVQAVMDERTAVLESVPGIGKKTARRLIVELKDRLAGEAFDLSAAEGGVAAAPFADPITSDALMALENLGYRRNQAEGALAAVRAEKGAELALPDMIRHALRYLGR